MVEIPSPAVAVVGRHNSGKTTLVVALIEEPSALDGVEQADGEDPSEAEEIARAAEAAAKATLGE